VPHSDDLSPRWPVSGIEIPIELATHQTVGLSHGLEVFEQIVGLHCWNVRRGHGSFLTLDFGDPSVVVGESRQRTVQLRGLDRELMIRSAVVRGEWHLWIYCCEWSLSVGGHPLAHSESDDVTMSRALSVLDGKECGPAGPPLTLKSRWAERAYHLASVHRQVGAGLMASISPAGQLSKVAGGTSRCGARSTGRGVRRSSTSTGRGCSRRAGRSPSFAGPGGRCATAQHAERQRTHGFPANSVSLQRARSVVSVFRRRRSIRDLQAWVVSASRQTDSASFFSLGDQVREVGTCS